MQSTRPAPIAVTPGPSRRRSGGDGGGDGEGKSRICCGRDCLQIARADQIEEESFSYSDTAEGQFIMYSCRWRGMFLEEFELQDFPLDMQEYSLRIEAMSNGFFTDHKGRCDERHRKTVLKPVSQCPAAFLRRNPVSLCRGDAIRSSLEIMHTRHRLVIARIQQF